MVKRLRKLTLSMEHLSPEDREKAERVLDHIKALDAYARVTFRKKKCA